MTVRLQWEFNPIIAWHNNDWNMHKQQIDKQTKW